MGTTTMYRQVMLIDDSDVDLLYGRLMIERAGIAQAVHGFVSAREALLHLQRPEGHEVDLVLLDINMPGMNGFDFLAAYEALDARQRPQCVVVMLTSSPDPDDRARAFSHSVVKGYVTKPMTRDAAQALAQWRAG
jgi:CheY-like chemotaxis protein